MSKTKQGRGAGSTQRTKAIPTGWRSMRTAPRDGTIILVCESPNSEHYNVMPAAYQLHQGNPLLEGFWGVWTTSFASVNQGSLRSHLQRESDLPVDFRALAITPLCWQPLPVCESIEKLRRRAAQVYARAAKLRKTPSSTYK